MIADYSEHKFVMLDPDARFNSFAICDNLSMLGFKPLQMPDKYEDPGDKNWALSDIVEFIKAEIAK